MATLLEIVLLAVIQGLTEWLPISSSGHLVIAQEYLGLRVPVFFDIVLHLGSLVVVLAVLWKDVLNILKAVARLDFKSEDGKLALYVILGSMATAVIGLTLRDLFESFFHNLLAVGVAFIITGSFYSIVYVSKRGKLPSGSLSPLRAVLVGIAQGVALIPGISRSGSTIATGLLLKVESKVAFRFSFLLFVPAIIGSTVLTALDSENLSMAGIDYFGLFLGLVATVIVGFFSLKLLLKVVLKDKMHVFAYYCWALGLLLVLSQVVRI